MVNFFLQLYYFDIIYFLEALFLFNFEQGDVMSGRKTKGQKTQLSITNDQKLFLINLLQKLINGTFETKINNCTTLDNLYRSVEQLIEELHNNETKIRKLSTRTHTSIVENNKQLVTYFKDKITSEEIKEQITTILKDSIEIDKLKKLPIPILNKLNLNSKKLEQLPNNILQELSVEHLIKLPLEKLKQLDLTNKPTEYPIKIFKTTQELKDNIKLKGNEGYLMINGEFIKTDEFLSGFEFEKDSFQPIDAQYANEIQKIMYGDIQPQNLNTLEHNLSHSEQRMMLYILQQLQKGEKIDEIVMFTGRKCCPVCHEALPRFMEYIKKNYSGLVPETMAVYDFWNSGYSNMSTLQNNNTYKETYWTKNTNNKEGLIQNEFYRNIKSYEDLSKKEKKEIDSKKDVVTPQTNQQNNIIIYFNAPFECYKKGEDKKTIIYTPHSKETYSSMLSECKYKIAIINKQNVPIAEPYYKYNSNLINYKSVFDTSLNKMEKEHLSKFVSKINNNRTLGTNDTIGNLQYTVESLKGDSNVPIVFSVEELEKIYNEKKIKAEQDEVFKLINKVNSLNKKLEQIKNNKIINAEIKQLLNDILQHNKRYSQSTEQIDRLDTLDQNELNTDNLEQIINDITKIIQQDVEKIKEQKDKIITILDKDIIKKKLEEIQQQSENIILQQDKNKDKEITEEHKETLNTEKKHKNILDIIQKEEEQFAKDKKTHEKNQEQLKRIQLQHETFKQHAIRYRQSTIALETLQERQNNPCFNLQNYLKKTFAIDNIGTNTQLHLPPSNTDGTLSKSLVSK